MMLLDDWMENNMKGNVAPLFDTHGLVVRTFAHSGRRTLKRSEEFDALMINTVETGMQKEGWEGIIYVMHWRDGDRKVPLYIGKAERKGVSQDLSFNLANIRRNQHAFGRWGYGLAYHTGDLSHAMFRGDAYKKPDKKYARWVESLFSEIEPPTLRQPVHVALIGWYAGMKGPSGLPGSVPAVEKELIALAGSYYPMFLLNRDGR